MKKIILLLTLVALTFSTLHAKKRFFVGGSSGSNESLFDRSVSFCDDGKSAGCLNLGIFYSEGRDEVEQDLAKSLKYFKKTCDMDNGKGCTRVGEIYRLGNGVPKNQKLSFKFYKKGCKLKSGTSCLNMGFIYGDGDEAIQKDPVLSALYYEKSCLLGVGFACHYSASAFYNGTAKGGKNKEKSTELWKRSCDLDFGKGCYMYGLSLPSSSSDKSLAAYKKGCSLGHKSSCKEAGIKKRENKKGKEKYEYKPEPELVITSEDRELAAKAYAKSFSSYVTKCEEGSSSACQSLSSFYKKDTQGVKKDIKKEREYLSKAIELIVKECSNGVLDSCLNLSYTYEYGRGDAIKKDLKRSKELHKEYTLGVLKKYEASPSSEMEEQAGIAYLDSKGYGVQDYEKALAIFNRGCESEDKGQCYWLGTMYIDGTGVSKDIKKGKVIKMKSYTKTEEDCAKGNGKACSSVGLSHYFGLGDITKDRALSKKYYKQSCSLGHAGGCVRFGDIVTGN